MGSNSFGKIFTITTFGESHGPYIGAVIDGCPPGITIDASFMQHCMQRRRPGQNAYTTARNEADEVQVISGVFQGKTTGAPITLLIANHDMRSPDYDEVRKFYRPSHADFTYEQKYGNYDYRGGGRSSARTTAAVVAAGAIALQILKTKGIRVVSYVQGIGPVMLEKEYNALDLNTVDDSPVRCPDADTSKRMMHMIDETKAKGDTVGGIIRCVASGVPPGLGDPLFDKLNATLAKAMFSINAVKGVSFGDGFDAARSFGSVQNDVFEKTNDQWHTRTNHSGGIQGGISNGMDIVFDVAFKPVSTLMQPQETADKQGNAGILEPGGRHDACVVPRAVAIVDAFTALVLLDHLLIQGALQGI